jgi:peptidoglycan/xylan/chitin deacetylase (PgdA/CDA1 family)
MKIALTFDVERDIPNLLDTTFGVKVGLIRIIKVLDMFDIKGTFFCTGKVAEGLPEHIQTLEQEDHEIACHGLNHERFYKLNFENCQEAIYKNKKILEGICQNSEIIGFRSPYLRSPKFLFKILSNLKFRYDSSIRSSKMLTVHHRNNSHIQEFHPTNFNALLRLPLTYTFFRNRIFKKKINILCFHPWEAIEMKKVVLNNLKTLDVLNRVGFRPDRVVNTGEIFIKRLTKFIKEALSIGAEFIMLKELLTN